MTHYLLYNPLANNGEARDDVSALGVIYEKTVFVDITAIDGFEDFFSSIDEHDKVIICGGDGTLHHFVNNIRGIDIKNEIYFYSIGTGNDFVRDLDKKAASVPNFAINKYISALPSVEINGKEYLFVNGVGYGIDGYCCEEGEKLRKTSKRPVNYAKLAVKGLLGDFHPVSATVTVDGKKHTYNNVWIAPTMNGRYYGGGMICAPDQDRLNKYKKLTAVIMHDAGRLKTLSIFPSIFKGTHVKFKKHVSVLTGYDITVEFDHPAALQIDGEVFSNVSKYHVKSAAVRDPDELSHFLV